VIDSNLADEMHVTVIVTGLGGEARQAAETLSHAATEKSRLLDATKTDGTFDYQQLDRPALLRKQTTPNHTVVEAQFGNSNYLDIPAFLRREE
jgi:cell division protein FtsZ